MKQQYKAFGNGLFRYSRTETLKNGKRSTAASWVLRYQRHGERHEIGLGSCSIYNLTEARKRARRMLQMIDDGVDPKAQKRLGGRRAKSFRAYAESHLETNKAGRSAKHHADWAASLAMYAYPVIGDLPIGAVDTDAVKRVLMPIWQSKTVTAGRVRQRIETILDAAKADGERTGENPARWKGHLKTLLPAISKVAPVKHFVALPYDELAPFMAALRGEEGPVARALEFLILCGSRSDEVLGAPWAEIDLKARLWTIPGERMKSGREHRVPLSGAAMALLTALPAGAPGDLLFTRPDSREALPARAMLDLLNRLLPNRKLTVHGLRSSFRDWVGEETNFPREMAEIQLAHRVGTEAELAYRHGDMFKRRRALAEAWAKFIGGSSAKVIALPQRAAG